jgi:hypothetical protein
MLRYAWTLETPAADSTLRLHAVSEAVYGVVGELGNRRAENLGNNATFGFVITTEGVVLVDSAGSHKGAANIHALISTVTDQPVRLVINTSGQDHRWLGNGYLRERGAADGEIQDVGSIDQSAFSHLLNYQALKGRNAQKVFEELEWE